MTTATPAMLAFRCTRCWQSNVAGSDQCGAEVQCRHCGHALIVPDATPQRIALAEEVSRSLAKPPPSGQLFQESPPSDRELEELVRQECCVPLDQRDFSGYPAASILSRLIAVIIDGLLMIVSFGLGLWLTCTLSTLGVVQDPLEALRLSKSWGPTTVILISSLAAMLCVGQWIFLSKCGQTVGKMLMSIRIVSLGGRVPGFVQTVVVRNWLRHLLSCIPFFALIDLLFGLGGDHRCIHDWISGTRVVSDCG
jgi:uncharacterized RDD family membrane protein YckC/DNA-directed RNA polymerase subunit RPC12/RpoP